MEKSQTVNIPEAKTVVQGNFIEQQMPILPMETVVSTAESPAIVTQGGAVCAVAEGIDYEADAGVGSTFTRDDIQIPFLKIVQGLSPYRQKNHPDYIEGCVEGDIVNSVTRGRYDGREGILVIPCFYEQKHVEWKPNRGGFVASHDISERLMSPENCTKVFDNKTGKTDYMLKNGNLIIDTRYHYVLVMEPETEDFYPVVISMAMSQIKVSRRWNTLIQDLHLNINGKKITPAIYAGMWRLKTKSEFKDNNCWENWIVDFYDYVKDKWLYEEAKHFHNIILQGNIKLAQQVPEEEPVTAGTESKPSGTGGADCPF